MQMLLMWTTCEHLRREQKPETRSQTLLSPTHSGACMQKQSWRFLGVHKTLRCEIMSSLRCRKAKRTSWNSPSTSSSGKITGLRKERTSGIVQSPLYMNLVVTARTGISARESQAATGDLHIAQLSGVVSCETDPAGAETLTRCRRNRGNSPRKLRPSSSGGICWGCESADMHQLT